jgi:hypothetical protein
LKKVTEEKRGDREEEKRRMEEYTYTTYDRPGLWMSPDKKEALTTSLRDLGRESLNPLPNYQVFSTSPHNLDDKIIITAHTADPNNSNKQRLAAFTSSLVLDIPGLDEPVVNAGLTVVSSSARRQGLLVKLFIWLFAAIRQRFPRGRVWLTSLAEVPNSLVQFGTFVAAVYPSPGYPHPKPTDTHLLIARAISALHRDKMLISPAAVWDEEQFVMRGSNLSEEGKCFMKDVDDERHWHRDQETNEFYRRRFRRMMGDEVLQVGWIDDKWLGMAIQDKKFAGHELQSVFAKVC